MTERGDMEEWREGNERESTYWRMEGGSQVTERVDMEEWREGGERGSK